VECLAPFLGLMVLTNDEMFVAALCPGGDWRNCLRKLQWVGELRVVWNKSLEHYPQELLLCRHETWPTIAYDTSTCRLFAIG
jgi:hypothetical protein